MSKDFINGINYQLFVTIGARDMREYKVYKPFYSIIHNYSFKIFARIILFLRTRQPLFRALTQNIISIFMIKLNYVIGHTCQGHCLYFAYKPETKQNIV